MGKRASAPKELSSDRTKRHLMDRQTRFDTYGMGKSGRDIALIVLAILIVALFWNVLGVIFRFAIFAIVVYLAYRILQHYL